MAKKTKFDYFEAFEELAHIAVDEADLLIRTIEEYTTPDAVIPRMNEAHELEHRGDIINHKVFTSIATDFITPLEREDLVGITQNLDDVLDYIEDVFQCFYMYDIQSMQDEALEFARLIKKSCEALDTAMANFRNFKKSKKIRKLIIDVCDVEEEVDTLFFAVVRKLHTEEIENALHVYKWDELFQRLENAADACEQAADRMTDVLLKNA
jgi:predicted phosphate transport protein (TIGR00153 family)